MRSLLYLLPSQKYINIEVKVKIGILYLSLNFTFYLLIIAIHPKFGKRHVTGAVGRNPSLIRMADYDSLSLEEEVEMLAQEEINKVKRASNLHDANGDDYAPWMGIKKDDEERIKQLIKERVSARRKAQKQEHDVSGALFSDRQEPSGTGLKTKIIDGEVELEWVTNSEKDTKGFLVERRPAKTSNFTIIASYNDWGPLQTKGFEGGVHRFLDTTCSPGSWVYRVSEVDTAGKESDVCECLVDVQTPEEQLRDVITAVCVYIFFILSFVAGVLLDDTWLGKSLVHYSILILNKIADVS